MPNVDGKKYPYTPAGKVAAKDAAKKAALKNMVAKKKANATKGATPTPMINLDRNRPGKPKSPSGMLMQPVSAKPAPAKAMAYGQAPKKAMSSDTKSLDEKFGR